MRNLAIVATHRSTYFESLVKLMTLAGGESIPLFGKFTPHNVLTVSEQEGYGILDALETMFGDAWSFSLISANAL